MEQPQRRRRLCPRGPAASPAHPQVKALSGCAARLPAVRRLPPPRLPLPASRRAAGRASSCRILAVRTSSAACPPLQLPVLTAGFTGSSSSSYSSLTFQLPVEFSLRSFQRPPPVSRAATSVLLTPGLGRQGRTPSRVSVVCVAWRADEVLCTEVVSSELSLLLLLLSRGWLVLVFVNYWSVPKQPTRLSRWQR